MIRLVLIALSLFPLTAFAESNWVKYLECPDLEIKMDRGIMVKVLDPKVFKGNICILVSDQDRKCFPLSDLSPSLAPSLG